MKRKNIIKTAKRIIENSHLWTNEEVIYAQMMLYENKLLKKRKKQNKKGNFNNVETMG
jgi:hypothetical protein